MRRLLLTTLLSSVCATSTMAASSFAPTAAASNMYVGQSDLNSETLWLAKDDKAKKPKKDKKPKKAKKEKKPKKEKKAKLEKKADKHKGKKAKHDEPEKVKRDKPEKVKHDKPKKAKKPHKDHVEIVKPKKADVDKRVERFIKERDKTVEQILKAPAPEGRDMVKILSATALALAAPNLNIAAAPAEEVVTYRNCPPGLAKKDPPCVPPGLAKQGVSYEQWASYSDAELNELLEERREPYVEAEPLTEQELLLLTSAQIADLYALAPAPDGQRYALIDGQPVLLTEEDYTALLRINELANIPLAGTDTIIAPTAALSVAELIQLYQLPEPDDGYNYAVLNGQVVSLRDDAYETLQLIRVARAVL